MAIREPCPVVHNSWGSPNKDAGCDQIITWNVFDPFRFIMTQHVIKLLIETRDNDGAILVEF